MISFSPLEYLIYSLDKSDLKKKDISVIGCCPKSSKYLPTTYTYLYKDKLEKYLINSTYQYNIPISNLSIPDHLQQMDFFFRTDSMLSKYVWCLGTRFRYICKCIKKSGVYVLWGWKKGEMLGPIEVRRWSQTYFHVTYKQNTKLKAVFWILSPNRNTFTYVVFEMTWHGSISEWMVVGWYIW